MKTEAIFHGIIRSAIYRGILLAVRHLVSTDI